MEVVFILWIDLGDLLVDLELVEIKMEEIMVEFLFLDILEDLILDKELSELIEIWMEYSLCVFLYMMFEEYVMFRVLLFEVVEGEVMNFFEEIYLIGEVKYEESVLNVNM